MDPKNEYTKLIIWNLINFP